jgi:hypothetical protein
VFSSTKRWSKNLKGRNSLENVEANGRIIGLNPVEIKCEGMDRLKWFRIRSIGRPL